MRSLRRRFEVACRIAAFALLGWLLGSSVIPSTRATLERASATELASRLPAWTRAPSNTALHGVFRATPERWAVDWLAALEHGGRAVSWSGSPPALALAAEALPDPGGEIRIDVAAPENSNVVVGDGGGTIDSARVSGFGASVLAPVVIGSVVARAGDQRAVLAVPDAADARSILVIGRAGWEGKFIVSALEERGWPVIARFSVAPNVDVAQGAVARLDTSRVAAVVAIDSLGQSQADAIERFVRSGGGLVLAGPSSVSPAVRSLAPGVLGARTRPVLQSADTLRLGSTGFYPVKSLNAGGIALERRSDGVALAARRVGAGRVLQVGYDDSWRWRMAGATGSERAHREWWSRMISAVAYVPSPAARAATMGWESAPVAGLVDRLGAAQREPPAGDGRRPIDNRLFLAAIMILLIAEWGSRRLRGLR
jgi:hypothetical protein